MRKTFQFPIDLFRVDASSGWLMLNGKLDREMRDKYEFTVMAVDGQSVRRSVMLSYHTVIQSFDSFQSVS